MTVRVERSQPRVAELVLDRPEALNAISTAQAEALTSASASLPFLSLIFLDLNLQPLPLQLRVTFAPLGAPLTLNTGNRVRPPTTAHELDSAVPGRR